MELPECQQLRMDHSQLDAVFHVQRDKHVTEENVAKAGIKRRVKVDAANRFPKKVKTDNDAFQDHEVYGLGVYIEQEGMASLL